MSKYKIIRKKSELLDLIAACKKTGYASIDYETNGEDFSASTSFPTILGVSFQPGSSYILPLQHFESPFKNNWLKMFKLFSKEVLENPDIVKVAWNIKFEMKWGYKYGSFMKGRLFDGMLAKYCLDEERPHGLKEFVGRMFPLFDGYEDEVAALNKKYGGWDKIPLEPLAKYCGLDTDLTLRGMIIMEPKLIKQGFYNLFRNLLMGLARVLSESEYRGFPIDRPYLMDLAEQYRIKIAAAEKKLNENPGVLKYEKKHRVKHLQELVENVRYEIAQIQKENKPNAARLIANRELKIKGYYEGKFNNKEKWEGINFGSPKQLIDFLFIKKYGLRLPILEYTKDKKTKKFTTTPSTAEDTLERLKAKDKFGFIEDLLALRALVKLDSTYVSGMVKNLDEHNRIHSTFHIQGTVTGRLSSTEPNLQNIPRGTTASDIKTMFIPPKGYLLMEVDYSQAELRLIAEIANDRTLIDIFKRNYNPHVATACLINGGVDQYDKVKGIIKTADSMTAEEIARPENKNFLFWAKQKKRGKSLNFSILYQQGPKEMALELGCTEKEALAFQEDWFSAYPGIRKWIKSQKAFVKQHGYVMNIFGRKRRLPDIWSDKFGFVSKAQRDAINAPIQGGAGDFTSYSEIVIRERIKKGEFPIDFHQICTVHDSIDFLVRPYDIHKVYPKVAKICESPETLKYFGFEMQHVTMKVAGEVGNNWGAVRDYDPWTDYTKFCI